jgi:branched-chain amino acid transport system permease protein
MLATYVGLGTSTLTRSSVAGVAGAVGAAAAIGTAAHLAVYSPVASHRRAGMAGVGFLPALGVALVVRNVAVRADPEGSSPFPSLFPGRPVRLFGDYHLPPSGWWLVAAGVVVPVAVALLLRHTATGRSMRAVADEPVLARLNGIPVTRTLASAYALAGVIGGLAGVLFASFFGQVFVTLGWQATLKGFVAAVLGGVGWVRGAILGGLALGIVESFVSGYLSTRFRDVVTFALLIGVLLLVPRGVLAGDRLRTV